MQITGVICLIELGDRSERFILAGAILGMCLILLVIGMYKPEHASMIFALVGTWMGSIIGYFFGKNGNGVKK